MLNLEMVSLVGDVHVFISYRTRQDCGCLVGMYNVSVQSVVFLWRGATAQATIAGGD